MLNHRLQSDLSLSQQFTYNITGTAFKNTKKPIAFLSSDVKQNQKLSILMAYIFTQFRRKLFLIPTREMKV